MYPIVSVEALNAEVTRMVVRAPEIARKIKPGQFIMLRIDEHGERIPLTMAQKPSPHTAKIALIAFRPLLFNDKAIVARNLRGCNGLDLTCGVRYNNNRKGAATSGWPFR